MQRIPSATALSSRPDDDAAFEAVRIAKRYGSRVALAGVDVRVRRGEVHGLLGPNGAGKTTLLRIALGLIRADAGVVRVLGCPVGVGAALPPGVAGFVEAPAFYPYLSGAENLALLARLDERRASAAERADLLDRLGLAAHANRKVAGYSAGMRQRLGLAAALLRSPRLLLLDEPTIGLDASAASELRDEVRRLSRAGTAVILSSHDMSVVSDLCATLTVVRQGRAIFSGSITDLRAVEGSPVHRLWTSDDAATLAATPGGIEVCPSGDSDGLVVTATQSALDAFVIALGRADIAVRRLEPVVRPLESLVRQIDPPRRALDGETES